jgi:probable HAF family extracellular repeat protein
MHRVSRLQLSTFLLVFLALTTSAFSQTANRGNRSHLPVSYVSLTYPGSSRTIAYGINNVGAIVGGYATDGNGYGFVYAGGRYRSLSYPGKSGTNATGINDSGAIVGTYSATANTAQSYLFQSSVYSEIRYPSAPDTFATGINNAGDIVGNYQDSSNNQHGFLYSGGVYSTIDPPGSVRTLVGGINSSGEIVGVYCVSTCTTFQAFSYSAGTYTDLSGFPGSVQLAGVNTSGDIVGNWDPSSGVEHDLFYNASSSVFVPFDIDGSADTSAEGVNDNCSIVGFYVDPTSSTFVGYYVRSSSCE